MYQLRIKAGESYHYLFGAAISDPVKGCRRRPGKDAGAEFVESIEVILHGAPGTIDAWVEGISVALGEIGSGLVDGWLEMQPESRENWYSSKILQGSISFLGHGSSDRARGGLGVVLELRRVNFWEGGLQSVPLSNRSGVKVVTGVTVYNSNVSGDPANEAWIYGEDVEGDLPAAVRLTIANDQSTGNLGRITVGQSVYGDLEAAEIFIEAEAGTSIQTWAGVTDANCSGAAYGLVQWVGTAEAEIVSWLISRLTASKMGGRVFRPMLRLASLPATDDFWLRWGVSLGGIEEMTGWQKLSTSEKLQAFPAVHLPPCDVGDGTPGDVTVRLYCRRDASGTHALAMDWLCLMPVEGWRRYEVLGDGMLENDMQLVDDQIAGVVYTEGISSGLRYMTHAAFGKGLQLVPGRDQRFFFQMERSNGECVFDDKVTVKAAYRPRRKRL